MRWLILFAALLWAAHAGAETQVVNMCPTLTPGTGPALVICGTGGTALPVEFGSGSTTLAYGGSTSASVATTSGTLIAAGAYKTAFQICTLPASTTNIWLNPDGAAAVVSTGVPVWAGGNCTNFGTAALPIPTTAITAITDSGSAQTVVLGGG